MFILTCIKTLHQSQVLKEDATELQLGYNENMSLFFFFSIFYFFFTIFFLFVVDFVIHWNETAKGLHVFPMKTYLLKLMSIGLNFSQ